MAAVTQVRILVSAVFHTVVAEMYIFSRIVSNEISNLGAVQYILGTVFYVDTYSIFNTCILNKSYIVI